MIHFAVGKSTFDFKIVAIQNEKILIENSRSNRKKFYVEKFQIMK